MSGPSQCAQIRPELGVYVLGAIAPADRAMVGRHVASCPRCREEVAGLVGLQNSAIGADLGFYAARSYSLMRPPRTSRRLIRWWERSATG